MTHAPLIAIDPSAVALRVSVANTLEILGWSYGEITTPELFDVQAQTFHPDGFFSEKIFGTLCPPQEVIERRHATDAIKDFFTRSTNVDAPHPQRGKRFAHIYLSVPVIHPWFWGHDDAPLELLLGMTHRQLRQIAGGHVRVEFGESGPQLTFDCVPLSDKAQRRIAAKSPFQDQTGPAAIDEMLSRLNYAAVYDILREQHAEMGPQFSPRKLQRLTQRLELLRATVEGRLKPDGFVIEALPVLPPGLRGLFLTPDGRVRTDWLTAAYRRILRTSIQYRDATYEYIGQRPPTAAEHRHVRRLRIALNCEIEWLFAELLRRGSPVRRDRFLSRPPRLSWGRKGTAAVLPLVPDPTLRPYQCRLPKSELSREVAESIVSAHGDPLSGETPPLCLPPVLCELLPLNSVADFTVLRPLPGMDRAMHVHPLLMCAAEGLQEKSAGRFHALHRWAKDEADRFDTTTHWSRSLPALAGRLPWELVIGAILATRPPGDFRQQCDRRKDSGFDPWQFHPRFRSLQDVLTAWENRRVTLSQIIAVNLADRKLPASEDSQRNDARNGRHWICTTAGRAVMNAILPAEIPFCEQTLTESVLRKLLQQIRSACGPMQAARTLETLMEYAIRVLTSSGLSFSSDDFGIPGRHAKLLEALANERTRAIKLADRGILSASEVRGKILDACLHAREQAEHAIHAHFAENLTSPLRTVCDGTSIMTRDSLQALSGMGGFVYVPAPEFSHFFVASNYHSGMRMQEYFCVAAAVRRKLIGAGSPLRAVTAIRRRLANLLRDVIVTEEDCGTQAGLEMVRGDDPESPTAANEQFAASLIGRGSLETIRSEQPSDPVIRANDVITRKQAEFAAARGRLRVRHVVTCEARVGVCRRCIGADPATGELVPRGTTVGIRAALAIGSLLERLPLVKYPRETAATARPPRAAVSCVSGVVSLKRLKLMLGGDGSRVSLSSSGHIEVLNEAGDLLDIYQIPHGAVVLVAAGDRVQPQTVLAEWNPQTEPRYSRHAGRVQVVRGAADPSWTLIKILNELGSPVDGCLLPPDACVLVTDGARIKVGELLGEVPRLAEPMSRRPSQDLRGVRQILSDRFPRRPAVLAKSDGRVELRWDGRSPCCEILIHGDSTHPPAQPVRQLVRLTKRRPIVVRTGDRVDAGERLTAGTIDLRDVVRLCGPARGFRPLLAEIRHVFAATAGLGEVDGRYWELLLAQRLRWAKVASSGDAGFRSGEILPRAQIQFRNKQLRSLIKIRPHDHASQDVPDELLRREEFELLRAKLLIDHPGSKPIEPEFPWPAGWTSWLLGWSEAAARSGSVLTSGGFSPAQLALVQAALEGRVDTLSPVKDAVLLGRTIAFGGPKEHELWNRP